MITTLDEARTCAPFSTIIVGGGMLGAVLADRLSQLSKSINNRILVIDSGPLILADHARNLRPPVPMSFFEPYHYTPWRCRSELKVAGLIRAVGGRSLIWGAWSPVPSDSELDGWPPQVVADLRNIYLKQAAKLLGIDDCDQSENYLSQELRKCLIAAIGSGRIRHIPCPRSPASLNAPLARNASSGRIFSPVSLLLEASQRSDQEVVGKPRLVVVPNIQARRLIVSNGTLIGIETDRGLIEADNADVLLALGTVETTRLASSAFPTNPLLGRNLMGHVITDASYSKPRSQLLNASNSLQIALFLLRGVAEARHFHIQVAAATLGDGEIDVDERLAREIPGPRGSNLFDNLLPGQIMLRLSGIGEVGGAQSGSSESRLFLSGHGHRSPDSAAEVDFQLSPADHRLWNAMDEAMQDVGTAIMHHAATNNRAFKGNPNINRLDLLVHEAGTMRMGTDSRTSVTDQWGRIHESTNLFVAGSALFPTVGSHNGSLTSVGLAMRLADKIAGTTSDDDDDAQGGRLRAYWHS